MNALPQAPCPHCQQPVNWFSPGCFSCRKPIQWPPPQNQQQQALQQASTQAFQQQLAYLQQQAAARQQVPAPPSPPAPVARAQAAMPAARPAATSQEAPGGALPGGDLDGVLETSRHDAVTYDPQAAEDVEGLLPQSYAEFVPANLTVQRDADVESTQVMDTGAGLGVTPFGPQDGLEATAIPLPTEEAPLQVIPDLDRGSFSALTQSAPEISPDGEVERTAVAHENRPSRLRKAKAEAGKRICRSCGTISDRASCPSCGTQTKELAA